MPNSGEGRYIPPALRNRPPQLPLSPSHSTSHRNVISATPSSPKPPSSSRTNSRTPWSSALPNSIAVSGPGPSSLAYRESQSQSISSSRNQTSGSGHFRSNSAVEARGGGVGGSCVGPSGPTLYVFGDSFVGPLKLLSDDCARITTFKGASAKGLNNPNSIKQVSADLLPAVNRLLAPPPYVYTPSSGRWALFVFGNVDLQINYLWQLQTKVISSLSFPASSASPVITKSPSKSNSTGDSDTEDDDDASCPDQTGSTVLATATETPAKGPALGPELFVETILRNYTAWLEREIINGPVGERLLASAKQRRNIDTTPNEIPSSSSSISRKRLAPPSKVLIAGALPPLVEDEMLSRVVEKYVERLEGEHEKAQKALLDKDVSGGSRTPWAVGVTTPILGSTDIEVSPSTIGLSDDSDNISTPSTSNSSISSRPPSEIFDKDDQDQDQMTSSTFSSDSNSPTPSASCSLKSLKNDNKPLGYIRKTPISTLLLHDPPLCTREIRIRMTNAFNNGLKEFCDLHKDVFGYIDITPDILYPFDQSTYPPVSLKDEMRMEDGVKTKDKLKAENTPEGIIVADRSIWACPVDPTNIHPLWEPTLPLWLKALKEHGVPTEYYRISVDAEETFKAYEIDKKRRTAEREFWVDDGKILENGRIKLRDE